MDQLKWLILNSKIYKGIKGVLLGLRGNRKLALSPECLLLSQHVDGVFNRYDVIVRLMAIEELQGVASGGLALYHKMQRSRNEYHDAAGQRIKQEDRYQNKQGSLESLVESLKQNGFDHQFPISVTPDLKLVDGSHRLAGALYLQINEITVKKSAAREVDFGLSWFSRYFEQAEIDLIRNRYHRLREGIAIEKVLNEILQREKQVFGRGGFYQSFERLGIHGQRPTSERYKIYKLDEHLSADQNVLDIGCNCGFFTLMIAEKARGAVGIEINQALVDIAQVMQVHLNRSNVSFRCGNFNKMEFEEKFDFICSFAVHHWLGVDMHKYGIQLHELLNPGGKVLLESQNINDQDSDWEEKLEKFKAAGFVEVDSGYLKDDGVIERRFGILQKDTVK